MPPAAMHLLVCSEHAARGTARQASATPGRAGRVSPILNPLPANLLCRQPLCRFALRNDIVDFCNHAIAAAWSPDSAGAAEFSAGLWSGLVERFGAAAVVDLKESAEVPATA